MDSMVVTIDGPAGAGKSTIARILAKKLGLDYLDTGALYRGIAWFLDDAGVPAKEGPKLKAVLETVKVGLDGNRVLVGEEDVSDRIRTSHVDSIASTYSALPAVREKLLDIQRKQVLKGGLVAEGRDMGTVVFPDADVKIYLSATDDVRARRRWSEMKERGQRESYEFVLEQIRSRDSNDRSRAVAPLRKAEDAVVVETSNRTIDEVVSTIVEIVRSSCK